MYYALVELASISTDESVNKIMKENLGITNYPAEFNSLISGDWLEKYPSTRRVYLDDVHLLDVKEKAKEFGYVRVSGELCDSSEESSVWVYCYLDDEGDWIDKSGNSVYIKNPVLSNEGKYVIEACNIDNISEDTNIYSINYIYYREEYNEESGYTDYISIYELDEFVYEGGYVRVEGDLCESWEGDSVYVTNYLDDEGDWLDARDYNNYEDMYIKNAFCRNR